MKHRLNFQIRPLNELAGIQERTWTPDSWREMKAHLNPWNDPFLDRVQLLRFNLQRAIHLRDDQMMRFLWANMGWEVEARIEAEWDAYCARYFAVYDSELEYIREKYLPLELERLEKAGGFKLAPGWADLSAHPAPYNSTLLFKHGLLDTTFPPTDPIRIQYNRMIERNSGLMNAKAMPYFNPGWSRWAMKEHDSVGPLSFAIQSSMNHLMWELSELAVESNALSGAGAKQRALFVNGDVPLPNDYTWLAWWAHVGIGFTGLSNNESLRLLNMTYGKQMTHMMSYVLPGLPMTREHRSGNQLLGDDSHSDHSLTSRSAAHSRNVHGRIQHGIWEFTTILCRADEEDIGTESKRRDAAQEIYLVANERIHNGNVEAKHLIGSHAHMLPRVRSAMDHWYGRHSQNQDVFMPTATVVEMHNLTGVVYDEYLVHPTPRSFHWAAFGGAFDSGLRSLAKFHRVYFRFDDDELGALAATEWRTAFVDCAIRYLRRSDADHARVQFESALLRQAAVRQSAGKRQGANKRAAFGLGNIFGDD